MPSVWKNIFFLRFCQEKLQKCGLSEFFWKSRVCTIFCGITWGWYNCNRYLKWNHKQEIPRVQKPFWLTPKNTRCISVSNWAIIMWERMEPLQHCRYIWLGCWQKCKSLLLKNKPNHQEIDRNHDYKNKYWSDCWRKSKPQEDIEEQDV